MVRKLSFRRRLADRRLEQAVALGLLDDPRLKFRSAHFQAAGGMRLKTQQHGIEITARRGHIVLTGVIDSWEAKLVMQNMVPMLAGGATILDFVTVDPRKSTIPWPASA